MTLEEAANILDPKTHYNAMKPYKGESKRLSAFCEACTIAAAALRTGHSSRSDEKLVKIQRRSCKDDMSEL